MQKVLTTMTCLCLMGIALTGCGGGGGGNKAGTSILQLTNRGLKPLENGFHYEGWALINGSAATTGKFNINASGVLVTTSGAAIPNGEMQTDLDLTKASAVVITIEPSGDTDKIAAATHIVAGSITNGAGTLTTGDSRALGSDFTSAAGTFILATPTDGDGNNETSGAWFVKIVGGAPQQGLTLPTLPNGWKYEGWAMVNGKPLSTGTFTNPSAADASSQFNGTQPAPAFPGEDFLRNAPAGLTFPTNLVGSMVVISIEPDVDDSPAPFDLKPLIGPIPATATDHSNLAMSNQAASTFPSMTVTVK
jgi:hypothetical protein